MSENAKLLEIFPFCSNLDENMCGGLSKAVIRECKINQDAMTMELKVHFERMPIPAELRVLSENIRGYYSLDEVEFKSEYPENSVPETLRSGQNRDKVGAEGKILYGRIGRGKVRPMKGIDEDSGRVIVEGDVIAVNSRLRKEAFILSFDLTDRTNTIRVSSYFQDKDKVSRLRGIHENMHLRVAGKMEFNVREETPVLKPTGIAEYPKEIRTDPEPEKRVELHLHTKMSALDGLVDPEAAVARAAAWGMPAIAVTDHGVLQAFPDMWKAGKKYGVKIIYGCECYFVNDERVSAVQGDCRLPLDTEYVSFDTETTGLNARRDRMTEIGAQIFRGTEVLRTFNTFVNPHMPIPPEITELTGIQDRDVEDAPDEKEAMEQFLAFAGNRPLVAHNAGFDIGFMKAACHRSGISFHPVYIDTVPLSQALLPDLKHFKLNLVAKRLKLPRFNHHRASDDALVVAQIMAKFLPELSSLGAETVSDIEKVFQKKKRRDVLHSYHMILLVQNRKGLKNLYEMVSQSYLKYFHRTPIIPKSVLDTHREGILVGSACNAGELYEAILRGASDARLKAIASYYDYLEVQPLANNAFLVENGTVSSMRTLEDFNRRIIALGKELGKPVAATCDVHFLDPDDEIFRKIVLASRKFADADRPCPLYFRTTREMLEEFSYLDEETARDIVIRAPRALAEKVESFELLPKELYPPKIENSAETLRKLVLDRMHELYGENPPEIVQKRVNTELNTILEHNYDVIYMSAQKLVQNSLEHGYLVGSRGSVGSSIVAYLAGITEVNSLPPHYLCPKCKYSEFVTDGSYGCGADMPDKLCPECGTPLGKDGFDIPFETFLGFPGNEKTPDIDLNFSGEYQARAHKYTEELFGADHVFRAGTIGTLAEKTAYGYVLKYLEENELHVSRPEQDRLARGLVGIKKTTSQHPGGLVIIPQDMDVTDFTAVQHPADDPSSGIITTHFEYHCMENNLLKLDELGHDDPTMIKMMEEATGVNARAIPLGEPETMKIFLSPAVLGLPENDPIIGQTGTLGIPEFGTGFTRQMLVDTKPTKYATLVRLSGFSHGTDVWNGNIQDLVLSKTATVDECVSCRDDIMLYLISKGMDGKLAFKTMEAVRKGKVKKTGNFPDGAEAQMEEMGVPDWYIGSCRKIAYLFPKAHAVAYVMMAFRIAWFKVHKPLAFYSAYFYRRSQKESFDVALMGCGKAVVEKHIRELTKNQHRTANEDKLLVTMEVVYEFYMRGFDFAPLDLYQSDATKFLIVDERHLRLPFVAVSGLGMTAAEELVNCRRDGKKFLSVEELKIACPKVSQTNIEMLRKLGALGDMPDSSQMSLFEFLGE
jgi:DNA polymerase-3 subunit alpha (Gram-positive type)